MTIEKLQNKLNNYTAGLEKMKQGMKEVGEEAKKLGHYINKGVLTKHEQMLIAFWDGSSYSHNDSETNDTVYNKFKGSEVLTMNDNEVFDDLYTWFNKGKTLHQYHYSGELGAEFYLINMPQQLHEALYDTPDNFTIICNDNYIKFTYKGTNAQGELSDGTYLEIRMAYKKEMFKCVEKSKRIRK